MKKKVLLLIIAVIVITAGALYFFVFRGGGGETQDEKLYSYVPGDYFVTNVKDSDSLLKVTVVLALNTDKLESTLEENEYIIRDKIIFELRSLTEEDILSEDIQDRLRTDITDNLNSALGIDDIVTVYFNDFVMQ
ncbi:MAG: flagellar basal body-associated protein FliL [Oscillospiraceae bacterium]